MITETSIANIIFAAQRIISMKDLGENLGNELKIIHELA
jgi:hypothetical protein